jgi:hypothetical protein
MGRSIERLHPLPCRCRPRSIAAFQSELRLPRKFIGSQRLLAITHPSELSRIYLQIRNDIRNRTVNVQFLFAYWSNVVHR